MYLSAGHYDVMYAMLITLCWFFSIYFNAKGDALIDNTGRRKHGLEGLSELFAVGAAGFVWLAYTGGHDISLFAILKYPFLRFGMFNLVYNDNRDPKLPWDYLGTTDWFDRQLTYIRDYGKSKKIPLLFLLYFIVFFTALFVN